MKNLPALGKWKACYKYSGLLLWKVVFTRSTNETGTSTTTGDTTVGIIERKRAQKHIPLHSHIQAGYQILLEVYSLSFIYFACLFHS